MTAITKYQGTINDKYNNQPILTVPGFKNFDLVISKAQFNSIENKDLVFQVLCQTCKPPSELAGLQKSQLCDAAEHVDNLYQTLQNRYRSDFAEALDSDEKTNKELTVLPTWKTPITLPVLAMPTLNDLISLPDRKDLLNLAAWQNLKLPPVWRKTVELSTTNVGNFIFNAWLAKTGCSRRLLGPPSQIKNDASAHRIAWLIKVGVLETERLKDTEFVLIESAKKTFFDLQEQAQHNEYNEKDARALAQLSQIYQTLFPEKSLEINAYKIAEYIAEKKKQHPNWGL